jgi:hypothetical protein
MNVLIRDIPDELNARMDATAHDLGISKQQMLLDLLAATYSEPPAVIGWVRFDRRGELDANTDCPECGQPFAEVWAGLLTNGQWVAPRCRMCAMSE